MNLVSTHTLRVDSMEEKIDAGIESLRVKNEIDPVQHQFTI